MWRKLIAERVDPEVVGELGIADGDVPGHAFAEAEPAEDAQRAGELLLAVQALVLHGRERRRAVQADRLRRQLDAVDRSHAGFCNRHAVNDTSSIPARWAGPARRYPLRRRVATMNREIMPSTIAPPAANYAHAMLSENAGKLLHVSGVVATRPDGTIPDDVADQAAVIWSNIAAILAEAEMAIDRHRQHHHVCRRRFHGLPARRDGRTRPGARRPSRRQHAGHRAGAGPSGMEDGNRDRRRSLAQRRPRVVRS